MDEHPLSQKERTDPRTNEELWHTALHEADEDAAYEAIAALHLRGSRDIFERACELCVSPVAHERRVGANVLGQLGVQPFPRPYVHAFHEETMAVLLKMLEHEQEPDVLNAIAVALGHRNDPRAIEPLIHLKNHPDDLVRYGVVFGLWGHDDELAIETLIEMSTDRDVDVRDWATTGLGTVIETDTPAIREALVARLADEDAVTRGEAMVGLAQRHDPRVVEPLLIELQTQGAEDILLEAAAEMRDPRLYPVLVQLRDAWEGERDHWLYRKLEETIEKCQCQ